MPKTKSLLFVFLIGGLVLMTSLFFVAGIRAQDAATSGNGLKISPTRIEMEVERGQAENSDFSIENVTDLPITADIIINDFVADEDGTGSPRLVLNGESDIAKAYSIKKFVTITDRIELRAGEQIVVPFSVSVPENTNPGSYFGVIRAAAVNASEVTGGTQIGLTASVGTIVIITVPGDTVELLTLKDITVHSGDGDAGSFFETAPDTIKVSLNNEGNIITKPFGKVIITNWSGDSVYEYELNDTEPRGNVLPGSFRTFTDSIEGIGSIGRYKVQANISYGPSGGSIIVAETSFWVIPWQTILVGLAATIGLVVFFTYGLKAYNRSVVNRSKGERHKTK